MKIVIALDCKHAALHDNIYEELDRILKTVPKKVYEQLERDGRCVCEALESADKLLDINGNTVGIILVKQDVSSEKTYGEMTDMELIDTVVRQSQTSDAMSTGRCDAGWAMLARLNDLRKRVKKLGGDN